MNKKKLPERILNHILEILYLLTGERLSYTLITPNMTKDKTTEMILNHTLEIMCLLTGEVPIKYDDVAVYFSMEEWDYIEGHKELYKDVIMETHQALRTMEIPGNESAGDVLNAKPTEYLCIGSQLEPPEQEICVPINKGDVLFNAEQIDILREENHLETLEQEISDNSPVNYDIIKVEEIDLCIVNPIESDEDTDFENQEDTDTTDLSLSWDIPSQGQSVDASFSPFKDQPSYVGNKLYPCSVCGKRFSQKSHLVAHQKIHTGEREFTCPICGKCFIRQSNLISHQKIHIGEKEFSCSDCGKSFKWKSNLITHQKLHTGVKSFLCLQCGKCFTQQSGLIRHQKIHTGEKAFSCSECGKCFNRKSHLIAHQKSHTGEKEFVCDECGKCFTQQSSLIRHRNIHKDEKAFSCSECDKCFDRKSSLISHQKNHTGEETLPCSKLG
ncbi:oocyte zinc finger protein XlCOF7.1-like [Bombina bombina]|uniref:oocyte zinc finger protein XlCOF7.1-like n=1 Tax=Bombina bombina TaxID=8345 RepID=UPI00235A9CC2|nr:oocyte zinc finger protein XlCOF7.1-like [Bombina bombina]